MHIYYALYYPTSEYTSIWKLADAKKVRPPAHGKHAVLSRAPIKRILFWNIAVFARSILYNLNVLPNGELFLQHQVTKLDSSKRLLWVCDFAALDTD